MQDAWRGAGNLVGGLTSPTPPPVSSHPEYMNREQKIQEPNESRCCPQKQ